MKKIFVVFLIIVIFLNSMAYVSSQKNISFEIDQIKGIYISYLEYLTYFEGNSLGINKSSINNMLDNIKTLGFNTIFLHTSPFSDAIYKSNIFPYSYTLTGIEGKNPGMDYLKYFIEEAHKRKIKVHAWINPYRISSSNDISKLSLDNPYFLFKDTNSVKVSNNGVYYNPASDLVVELLLKQVKEIINNYDVDGIHFDDYFYPDNTIDLENYQSSSQDVSLSNYRLNIINSTIKKVYQLIKKHNSKLIFSISPDGNIENNYELHYADIKTWLLENDYIDIIMPQVYYGFENDIKPFIETINEWNSLIKNNVKLVPVLAFYKVGLQDNLAGSGYLEWINNNDIIAREINYTKTLTNYDGITIFRYEYLFNNNLETLNTKDEILNLKKVIND